MLFPLFNVNSNAIVRVANRTLSCNCAKQQSSYLNWETVSDG